MQLQALASFHPLLSCFFLQHVDDQKSMRYQKTLLSFDVNVYTAQSTLTYHAAQQKKRRLLRRTTVASAANVSSVEVYV